MQFKHRLGCLSSVGRFAPVPKAPLSFQDPCDPPAACLMYHPHCADPTPGMSPPTTSAVASGPPWTLSESPGMQAASRGRLLCLTTPQDEGWSDTRVFECQKTPSALCEGQLLVLRRQEEAAL